MASEKNWNNGFWFISNILFAQRFCIDTWNLIRFTDERESTSDHFSGQKKLLHFSIRLNKIFLHSSPSSKLQSTFTEFTSIIEVSSVTYVCKFTPSSFNFLYKRKKVKTKIIAKTSIDPQFKECHAYYSVNVYSDLSETLNNIW